MNKKLEGNRKSNFSKVSGNNFLQAQGDMINTIKSGSCNIDAENLSKLLSVKQLNLLINMQINRIRLSNREQKVVKYIKRLAPKALRLILTPDKSTRISKKRYLRNKVNEKHLHTVPSSKNNTAKKQQYITVDYAA